jgi:chromate transporter
MILLDLFLSFFKVGLFCFGGAFGMIPLIEETVVQNGWLTQQQFYNFVGICESTPGPIAVNIATYVGSDQAGLLGSIAATLGVVSPSFLIILLVASVLKNFADNRYFKGFLKGVKPVIVALILSTGTILLAGVVGFSALTLHAESCIIFALLCGVYFLVKKCFKKKLPAVAIVGIAAALGVAVCAIGDKFC